MIGFDSILLLLFVITSVLNKEWSGWQVIGAQNPLDIPTLILIALTVTYLFLDVILIFLKRNIFYIIKVVAFFCIVTLSIGYPLLNNIILRHTSVNYLLIHDGALQTEIASRFFLKGKNPYSANYFGTPLEFWKYTEQDYQDAVNPALYHYAYMPFLLIVSTFGQIIQRILLGWEDLRFTMVVHYLGLLSIVWILTKNMKEKFLYLTLYALNPLTVHFLVEGRNDTVSFFYLIASALFLYRKNLKASAIFLGFSFAFKQTLWLAVPFFLCYVFYKKDIKNEFRSYLAFFIGTALLIILPFFIWDPKSFIDSTINYLTGATLHSYPISGIGFGRILLFMKAIPSSHIYYPFWIFQVLIVGPLLLFFLKILKRTPKISYIFLFFGITALLFFFFSRIFSDSYVTLIFLSLVTAALFYKKESKIRVFP